MRSSVACEDQESISGIILQQLPTLIFETGSLIGAWELTHWAGLSGHQAPRVFSFQLPSTRIAVCSIMPSSLYGHWGSNIGSYACKASTFTTELSFQPMTTFIKYFILHFKIHFLFNSVSICEYVHMHAGAPWRPEKGVKSPRTGVAGGC